MKEIKKSHLQQVQMLHCFLAPLSIFSLKWIKVMKLSERKGETISEKILPNNQIIIFKKLKCFLVLFMLNIPLTKFLIRALLNLDFLPIFNTNFLVCLKNNVSIKNFIAFCCYFKIKQNKCYMQLSECIFRLPKFSSKQVSWKCYIYVAKRIYKQRYSSLILAYKI